MVPAPSRPLCRDKAVQDSRRRRTTLSGFVDAARERWGPISARVALCSSLASPGLPTRYTPIAIPRTYRSPTESPGTQRKRIEKESFDLHDGTRWCCGHSLCGSNVPPNPRVLPERIPVTLITPAGRNFDAAMIRRRAASREDESLGHLDQITVADGHSIWLNRPGGSWVSGRRVTSVRAEAFRTADRMEVWIRRECLMRPSRTRARFPSEKRQRQRLVLFKDLPSFLWTSGQWMWTFGHWPDVLYLRFGQRGRRHHLTHPTQIWHNYIQVVGTMGFKISRAPRNSPVGIYLGAAVGVGILVGVPLAVVCVITQPSATPPITQEPIPTAPPQRPVAVQESAYDPVVHAENQRRAEQMMDEYWARRGSATQLDGQQFYVLDGAIGARSWAGWTRRTRSARWCGTTIR